jgi:glycosyltransferase involved in cell wall biosynthesis
MKIAVIGTRGIPNIQGGVETHCQELYPRLIELGCDITLFTRKSYATSLSKSYKGVHLIHLFAPKNKSLEAIVHTFLAVIFARLSNPDIVHIHAIGPSLLVPFAKLLRLKVVVTNHGPDYDRQKWGKAAKFVLQLGEKWGTKYADIVIVISNTIKNILEEKYGRKDCVLIPNGVNIPVKCSSTDYIESLGLIKNKYIIAVGRFVPEKGFHDLIEAYCRAQNSKYKLVLVGDADHETEYSRNLKILAKENNVVLTGFLTGATLNEIFSHAALFVMPSYHEGLPIALLEALSYETDVLVSNIPANNEIGLSKDCFFNPKDISTLSEKLLRKIQQPEKKFNRKSVNQLLTKFNWDNIANQTLRTYEQVKLHMHTNQI